VSTAIADYEPGERLTGVGGEVFSSSAPARLGRPDTPVVVHVLRPVSPDAFRLIRPVLEALATVRSPHVAALVDAGYRPDSESPFAWYVTEDHGRGDLRGRRVPQAQVLGAVAAAARGAHALHEAGLPHGEISAATVRPTADGAILEPPTIRAQSVVGGYILTVDDPAALDSVAPSVARGEPPSRASDLWSLGAILHRGATGELLHPDLPGDEPLVALQRVAFEPIRMAAGADPALASLVASCLTPDPADRPATGAALADSLERLVGPR
jgi:serine/threonine protein kinase